MNARVLGKGLELLNVKGGKFEINEPLFADDTALLANSEKKFLLLLLLCLCLLEVWKLGLIASQTK